MDTVTYPRVEVASFVAENVVPLKLQLGRLEHRGHIRDLGILWTPSYVLTDHRGRELRRDVGFLAPGDFLATLAIGVGQGLAATGRAAVAADLLAAAISRHGDGSYAAELLYWRGALGYLIARDHDELARWWDALRERFPGSIWSRRCVTSDEETRRPGIE